MHMHAHMYNMCVYCIYMCMLYVYYMCVYGVCVIYVCVCICVYMCMYVYICVCVYVYVYVCVYIYACFALVRVLVCSVLDTPDFIVSRHSCLLSREATRTFTLGYNNLVPFDLW